MAIGVWSVGACLHALCGWATEHSLGLQNVGQMLSATGAIASAVAITSVYYFIAARIVLGIGEAGNFPAAAREIYDRCNELLSQPGFSARGLMQRYNVEAVCTTDDPIDSLEYHRAIRESGFSVKVLPAWRPDKATLADNPQVYNSYIDRLAEAAGIDISSYSSLIQALRSRHDYFASQGCSVADHGVTYFPWAEVTDAEASAIFAKVRGGQQRAHDEVVKLQTAILLELCRMNHEKGWVQQFHFGPIRNVNSRRFAQLGPDTGFDSIGDFSCAIPLARFLNALESENALSKTILYNLNPADNTWVAAMAADFQDGIIPGKIQMGAAWWFNDQLYGMEAQMNYVTTQSPHSLHTRACFSIQEPAPFQLRAGSFLILQHLIFCISICHRSSAAQSLRANGRWFPVYGGTLYICRAHTLRRTPGRCLPG